MRTAFPKRKKRKREYGPLPFVISIELTFMPDEIEEGSMEYADYVRNLVRTKRSEILEERQNGSCGGFFEEYDDYVSRIIEEEVERN